MQNEVLVFYGQEDPERQPETFRFCPLGVQFYARKLLPEYQLIELDLHGSPGVELPAGTRCEGIVVHGQFDPDRQLYRHWILFMDLPEEIRRKFRCFAKESGALCPHCENF